MGEDPYWDAFRRAVGDELLGGEALKPVLTNETALDDLANWSRKIREDRARNPLLTAIIVHAKCPQHWAKPLYRTDGTVHLYLGFAMWELLRSKMARGADYQGIAVNVLDSLPSLTAVPVLRQGFDV